MERNTRFILWLLVGVLLTLPLAAGVFGQTRSPILGDEKKNDLLKRIHTSGTRMEEMDDNPFDLRSPGEKEAAKAKKKDLPSDLYDRKNLETFTTDPEELRRRMAAPEHMTGRDLLSQYERGTNTEELLKRIRESRTGEEDKKKEEKKGEKGETGESPLTREGAGTQGIQVPEYGVKGRFSESLVGRPGIIGSERLSAADDLDSLLGEARRRTGAPRLPDPNTNLDAYRERLTKDLGTDTNYLESVTPNLRGTVETQRLNREIIDRYDANLTPEGKQDLSKAFSAYGALGKLPPTTNSLGRRDAYVPNSTDFTNPTYRGSIYGVPYSSDPYQRNYTSDLARSKYSSDAYFNLNVRESFSDYYQREYGVNQSFVPGSTSRQFDVNTLQQWSASLRRDYGIDVRGTQGTYAEMYRLHTNKYTGP